MLQIEPIACLKDNYAYLVSGDGLCAVVDPSEPEPVEAVLRARGMKLTHILNTHHHWDHTGGNAALKKATGAVVVGPAKDRERIPGIDIGVEERQGWRFGEHEVRILEVPAHTRGAIAFVFPNAVFTGDTLFAMGCGRLFEGTPATMHASLAKLAALADDTEVYCGHEYTLNNGRFALTLEPGNQDLQARMKRSRPGGRRVSRPCPPALAWKKRTNPFLRTGSAEIRATLKMETADDVAGVRGNQAPQGRLLSRSVLVLRFVFILVVRARDRIGGGPHDIAGDIDRCGSGGDTRANHRPAHFGDRATRQQRSQSGQRGGNDKFGHRNLSRASARELPQMPENCSAAAASTKGVPDRPVVGNAVKHIEDDADGIDDATRYSSQKSTAASDAQSGWITVTTSQPHEQIKHQAGDLEAAGKQHLHHHSEGRRRPDDGQDDVARSAAQPVTASGV